MLLVAYLGASAAVSVWWWGFVILPEFKRFAWIKKTRAYDVLTPKDR